VRQGIGTARRAALVAGLGCALAGCAAVTEYWQDEDNTEPPAELTEFEPLVAVEVVWDRSAGSGTDKRYLKLRPAVHGTRVYTADRPGRVRAFDALTGEKIWETDTDVPIAGGPGASEALVLVGSSDGEVVALAAEDGAEVWRARVSSEVLAAPQAAEGVAVARTIDGKLFGLDADDGARLWVYDRTVPVLTLRGTSTPAIARGMAIAGFDSGNLVAVSLGNAQLVWESRVAVPRGRSELERMVDIDAEPVIEGDTIYVATYQGRVAALDLATGDTLWRRDMSSHSGLAIDLRNVYVTDESSHVWALDRYNSASVWRQTRLQARQLTSPAVVDGYVVVADLEGYVHWLRREDGQFAARVRVGKDPIIAPPVAAEGLVFVYTGGGTLAAMRVAEQ